MFKLMVVALPTRPRSARIVRVVWFEGGLK
jgi:hypothetical protein